jgi:hypothetical protein
VVAAVAALRFLVAAFAAEKAGVSAFTGSSWARWDSGLYVDIAQHGYKLGPDNTARSAGPLRSSAKSVLEGSLDVGAPCPSASPSPALRHTGLSQVFRHPLAENFYALRSPR